MQGFSCAFLLGKTLIDNTIKISCCPLSMLLSVAIEGIFGLRLAPAAAQSLGYYPLQLSVGTAEFIGSPFFNGLHCLCIYAQYKTFCIGFLCCHIPLLLMKCTCINNRLCRLICTEHYKQVAYHCSLALLVQFHNLFCRETLQSNLYH